MSLVFATSVQVCVFFLLAPPVPYRPPSALPTNSLTKSAGVGRARVHCIARDASNVTRESNSALKISMPTALKDLQPNALCAYCNANTFKSGQQ